MRKEESGDAQQAEACLRILSLAPCVEEAEWSEMARNVHSNAKQTHKNYNAVMNCYAKMDELGVTEVLLKVIEAADTLSAPLAIGVCRVFAVLGRHLLIRGKWLNATWTSRVLSVLEAHPASSVQEAALGALSQMMSTAVAEKRDQVLGLLATAMQAHRGDGGVLRAACLALKKLPTVDMSAGDKTDDGNQGRRQMAELLDLVLSATHAHRADRVLQAAACAAVAVLAGPTHTKSDLSVPIQAQLGKAIDRILDAMQEHRGKSDVIYAACATLLELNLNHAYLMRINAVGVVVGIVHRATSASDLSEADQKQCKGLYDKLKAAEKRDAEVKAKHQSIVSQVHFSFNPCRASRDVSAGTTADVRMRRISCACTHEMCACVRMPQGFWPGICRVFSRVLTDGMLFCFCLASLRMVRHCAFTQVGQVMSKAGKELKAAYALQIAIRCIPCLIARCTEASPGQSEEILLLSEKVMLDTSYRVAVKRSVAKLFAQHRANPSTFMDVAFKSLILPVVKTVTSSNVANASTTLTLFVPKNQQSANWRIGARFKGVTDIGVCLSDTKTDGSKMTSSGAFAAAGSMLCTYSTTEAMSSPTATQLEETRVSGDLVWVQMAGRQNLERFVAQGACQEIVVESRHDYEDNANYCGAVCIQGAGSLKIAFDRRSCRTESGCDRLVFFSDAEMSKRIVQYSGSPGQGDSAWNDFEVKGSSIFFTFTSDGSCNYWGYRFTVSVKNQASCEDSEISEISAESLSKFSLAQMGLACGLDDKACVEYLAQADRFRILCQLVLQQTGTRRVAFLQMLAQLIRRATLPPVFDLYFAPIVKKHAMRLDNDKSDIGREQGVGDLALFGTLCRSRLLRVCARAALIGVWQGQCFLSPADISWCLRATVDISLGCRVCHRMADA